MIRACKHGSSRTVIAKGMTHVICNSCGSPLQSPDLVASMVEYHDDAEDEKMARDARRAVKLRGQVKLTDKYLMKHGVRP